VRIARENNNAPTQSRIVGGTGVPSSQYPFFARWSVGCGATLVETDMLLSAAHCYTGSGDFGMVKFGFGKLYSVESVFVYPDFNGDYNGRPENDFILLRLYEPVPATIATPVTLNDNPNFPDSSDDWLTAIGYGSLNEDSMEHPDVLQKVSVPYLPTTDCQSLWQGETINVQTELCTMHPDEGFDACFGDSGGPLLTSENVQVGIVSWGDGCGRKNSPAVNARVSAVVSSWIRPQICEHTNRIVPPSFCQAQQAPEQQGNSVQSPQLAKEKKDPADLDAKCAGATEGYGGVAGQTNCRRNSGGLRQRRKRRLRGLALKVQH